MQNIKSDNLRLEKINPIFKDGDIPKEICINHFYQGYTDLESGKTWSQCYFCGHKTTK